MGSIEKQVRFVTKEKGEYMKLIEIKAKAKTLGIKAGKMKKTELIHAIQKAENNTPCFGESNGQCRYTDCCFIQDCVKVN